MALNFAAIAAALSKAPTVLRALAAVDPAAATARRLDDAIARNNREMAQVTYAIGRAMLSLATGKAPNSDDVETLLAEAVNDVRFPARVHRLIGEGQKTASRRKREILAAALLGLPHTGRTDQQLDRIDILVERLMPEDASLLLEIANLEEHLPNPRTPASPLVQRPVQYTFDSEVWIVPGSCRLVGPGNRLVDLGIKADPAGLASLTASGCIETATGPFGAELSIGDSEVTATPIVITELGRLFLHAMEDLRPILESPGLQTPVP